MGKDVSDSRHAEVDVLRLVRPLWGAHGVALALGAIQAVIVAPMLGAETYGIVSLYVGVPAFLVALINPQAEEAVVRFLAEHRVRDDGRPWGVVMLALVLELLLFAVTVGATLLVLYPLMGRFGVENANRWLVGMTSASLALSSATSTCRGLLAACDRVDAIAPVSLAGSIQRFGLTVGLTAVGGQTGFVVGFALAGLVEVGIFFLVTRRTVLMRLGAPREMWLERHHRREMLSFVGYSGGSTLASSLVKHADLVVLGWSRPLGDVGSYRLARSLVTPLAALVQPLNSVVYPRLAAAASANDWVLFRKQIKSYWSTIGRRILVGSVVFAPVMYLLLELVFGSEFEGVGAIGLVLLTASLSSIVLFWLRPALLAAGAVRGLTALSLVSGGLTVGGYLLVARDMGPIGVAICRAVFAGAFSQAVLWWWLWRRLKRSQAEFNAA